MVSWSRGVLPMRNCSSLDDYAPESLNAIVKVGSFTAMPNAYTNRQKYIKSFTGGPGVLYLTILPHKRIEKYPIGKWLEEGNESFGTLIEELNAAFEDFFTKFAKFTKHEVVAYAPQANLYQREGMYYICIDAKEKVSMDLYRRTKPRIGFDPNLCFGLKATGYNALAHYPYWESRCTHQIENMYGPWSQDYSIMSVNWKSMAAAAAYPIINLSAGNEWQHFYLYNLSPGPWRATEESTWSLPVRLKNAPIQEQLFAFLKEWIFKKLLRWESGAQSFASFIDLEFKPNKLYPNIKQLHIQVNGRAGWNVIKCSFSPTLCELFNWPSCFPSISCHDPSLTVDVSALAPPLYDILNRRDYISPFLKMRKEWNRGETALILSEPPLKELEDKKTILYSFYYESSKAATLVQSDDDSFYCESTTKSTAVACLDNKAVITIHEPGIHAFDLANTQLEIQAQIVRDDGTSFGSDITLKAMPISFGASTIKSVKLKLGDTVLDNSLNYYAVRDKMLGLVVAPQVSTKAETITPNNGSLYECSNFFKATTLPFKYNVVPSNWILTRQPLKIEVKLNRPSALFYGDTNSQQEFRVKVKRVTAKINSANLGKEIMNNIDPIRRHCLPHYNFKRWLFTSITLPAKEIEHVTEPIFLCPTARRFFITLSGVPPTALDEVNSSNRDWLTFKHYDLLKACVLQGKEAASEVIYFDEANSSSQLSPFDQYLKHRAGNLPSLSESDFNSQGNFILCFDRLDNRMQVKEDIPFHLQLIFAKPLPHNVILYFAIERDCELEMTHTGDVRFFKDLDPFKQKKNDILPSPKTMPINDE